MRELKKFKIEGDTVERDKKILLIATVQSHICQFHKPLVAMLHEHGCEVHVAARNNLAEKNGLKLDGIAGKETWGSLLAGQVLDRWGVDWMLLFCAALCAAGALLAGLSLRRPKAA